MTQMRDNGGLKDWRGWRDIKKAQLKLHDILESSWARRPYWRQSIRVPELDAIQSGIRNLDPCSVSSNLLIKIWGPMLLCLQGCTAGVEGRVSVLPEII